jgi:hypothetical protein
MKTAMIRLDQWMKKYNLQDEIKILLTMHDEIVFEMPENKLDQYVPQLNNIMCLQDVLQGILKWQVPLTLDAEYGLSWHVDHNLFEEKPELQNISKTEKYYKSTQIVETSGEVKTEKSERSKEISRSEVDESSGQLNDPQKVIKSEAGSEEKNGNFEPLNEGYSDNSSDQKTEETVVDRDISTNSPFKEKDLTNNNGDSFVYIIKDRKPSTLRRINEILDFLTEDVKKGFYLGPVKALNLRDSEQNSFLVSELKIPVDSFLGLCRYYGI